MTLHLIHTTRAELSPGMILDAPTETDDFLLQFGDETESRALFLRGEGGRPVLKVSGYMTMDGTVVAECLWSVREVVERDGRRMLRLGQPMD